MAHGVVAGDRDEALFALVWLERALASRRVRIDGLDPATSYRIEVIARPGEAQTVTPAWASGAPVLTGQALGAAGIPLPPARRGSALLLHLQSVASLTQRGPGLQRLPPARPKRRLGAVPDSASSQLAPPHEPLAQRPPPGAAGCATTRPGRPAHLRAGWLPRPRLRCLRGLTRGGCPLPGLLRCLFSFATLLGSGVAAGSAGAGFAGWLGAFVGSDAPSGRQISRSETAEGDGLRQPSSPQQVSDLRVAQR